MNRRNYGDSLVNLVGLQKQLLPKNPATPALVGCQSWEVQKDENINSVEIYCLTNKDGDEIIEWYKEKLNSSSEAKGMWNGFEMDVSYNKFSNLVSIILKKQ